MKTSIGYFNGQLSRGQYFFSDIKKEGILLYNSGRYELQEAHKLSPAEYRKKISGYFDHWFNSANEFFIDYRAAFERQSYSKAAFELHQATERYYSALLLVLTDYKPKTHDIRKLGRLAAAQEPKLLEVFPQGEEEHRLSFELLRKAYVDGSLTQAESDSP